jgi:hypothetical protein
VAEVHDVPAAARLGDQGARAARGLLGRAVQDRRIEVPLQRLAGDAPPRLGERDAPVHGEDVGPGRGHVLEDAGAAVHVQDHGSSLPPDPGNGPADGGKSPRAVISRRQLAGPRVEELHGLGPGRDLEGEDVAHDVGGQVEQAAERVGVAEHHLLDDGEALRAAPFDHVRGEGPGRAAESEDGRALAYRRTQTAEDLAREADAVRGIEPGEVRHGRGRPDGRGQVRARVAERDRDSHGLHRNEDVREEDHPVGREAPEGLERDLAGRLRVAAELEEAQPFSYLAVLWQVAAGLAHHPGRRAVDRPPETGIQETGGRPAHATANIARRRGAG